MTSGGTVLANAVQSDGKILLGGVFSSYNLSVAMDWCELTATVRLIRRFIPGGRCRHDDLLNCGSERWEDSDWRSNGDYDGASRNGVARLNLDGTLDTTFNPGSGVGSIFTVYGIAVQPDQKIVLGGNFISFNGVSRVRIARLNADGSVDSSFDPSTGPVHGFTRLRFKATGRSLPAEHSPVSMVLLALMLCG